ncbi:MAG: hypothetical protein WAK44_07560, partial [Trebonia sp.]
MTGRAWLAAAIGAAGVAGILAVALAVVGPAARQPSTTAPVGQGQRHSVLPTAPASYLGLYAAGVPGSYAGVTAFTAATGVKPRLVPYYSGWFEPFQARFATTVADDGAVPLVQIDPDGVSVASIAAGRY